MKYFQKSAAVFLIGAACMAGDIAQAQFDENGKLIDPGSYKGSMEMQRQSDQQNQQFRAQQPQNQQTLYRPQNQPGSGGPAGDRYGAIAFAPKSARYGYSYNYASLAEAQSKAISECGRSDCRNVGWVKNLACGALATGPHSSWGYEWDSDRGGAQRKALAVCARYAHTSCKISITTCATQLGPSSVASTAH